MKSTKGRYISKSDLQQQLLALRDVLVRLAPAADGDTSAPGEARNAVFNSVLLVRQFFNSIEGFQEAVKPLDVLIKAAVDLDHGHRPALFTPRKIKGAPTATLATDTLKVYALVAVQLYRRTGLTAKLARERVVREFSRRGVKIGGASTLKNWASHAADAQPSDSWLVTSLRANELLSKLDSNPTENYVHRFIQATAKLLARS